MFCLLVILFKLSVLARWLARKTPLRKSNRCEGIVSTKARPKTVCGWGTRHPTQHIITFVIHSLGLLLINLPWRDGSLSRSSCMVATAKIWTRSLGIKSPAVHHTAVSASYTYNLGVTVYKCLHGQAPDYLSELCTPVTQVDRRQHLCSAGRHYLSLQGYSWTRYIIQCLCSSCMAL